VVNKSTHLEDVWRIVGITPRILNLGSKKVSGQIHPSSTSPPGEGTSGIYLLDLVVVIVGLDAVEKRKVCCPSRESNPDSTVVHPVA
jgi:hypothetical protein